MPKFPVVIVIIVSVILLSQCASISAQENSTEVPDNGSESTTTKPDPPNVEAEEKSKPAEEVTMMPVPEDKPPAAEDKLVEKDKPAEPKDKAEEVKEPKEEDPVIEPRSSENSTNFTCSMLEMCDMDDPNAKIIGILEEKVIKFEKKMAELLQRLDEVEATHKNTTEESKAYVKMEMGNIAEKCGQCSENQAENTSNPPMESEPKASRNLPSAPMADKMCPSTPPTDSDATAAGADLAQPTPPSSQTMSPPPSPKISDNSPPAPPTPEEFHPLKTMGETPRCLEGSAGGVVLVKRCKDNSPQQLWSMKPDGTFQNKANQLCLDGGGEVGVVTVPCDNSSKTQQWETLQDNSIKNTGSFYCLTSGAYGAITAECDGNYWQRYDFLKRIRQPDIFFVTYLYK